MPFAQSRDANAFDIGQEPAASIIAGVGGAAAG